MFREQNTKQTEKVDTDEPRTVNSGYLSICFQKGFIVITFLKCVTSGILLRLYRAREFIIDIVAIGIGVGLAFGLSSPSRDLTFSIAGMSLYLVAIFLNPLKGLLLWLATQPLLDQWFSISLGASIPDLTPTRICAVLVVIILLARFATRYSQFPTLNKFDVVVLLFMVGITQSGPRGYQGLNSIKPIFDNYWIPILTYFAVRSLVTNQKSMYMVLFAVLFVSLYSAVAGVYEATTGHIISLSPKDPSSYHHLYYASGLRVLRSIYGNNEDLSRVIIMGIPIGLYFYLKASSPARKGVWTIGLVLLFVGLLLTYKRTAWMAIVVMVFVMQLFNSQFRRLFIGLLVVGSIISVVYWDSVVSSKAYTRAQGEENASTAEGRTEGWQKAITFWKARPLIGHGFRQYRKLAREGQKFDALESEHLDILVSSGLAGFLPYVGMFLLMGYDGLRHYRGQVANGLADRALIASFWANLLGYIITIQTAMIGSLAVPAMFFALAGAILYSRRSPPARSSEMEVNVKQAVPSLTAPQELAAPKMGPV